MTNASPMRSREPDRTNPVDATAAATPAFWSKPDNRHGHVGIRVTSRYARSDLLRDQGRSPLLYPGAAAAVAWRWHPRCRSPATTGRYSCDAHGQQSEDVGGGAGRPGHARHLAWQGRDNAGQGSPTADAYASGSVAHSTPGSKIVRHLGPRGTINGPWRILAACRPGRFFRPPAVFGVRRATAGMGGFLPVCFGAGYCKSGRSTYGASWPVAEWLLRSECSQKLAVRSAFTARLVATKS